MRRHDQTRRSVPILAGSLTVSKFPADILNRIVLAHDGGRLHVILRLLGYVTSFFVILIICAFPATLIASAFGWSDSTKNAVGAAFFMPVFLSWTYFYCSKIERRPWGVVGLARPLAGLPQLALGFLLASSLLGLVFIIEYFLGWIHVVGEQPLTINLGRHLGYMAIGLISNAGAGFCEEAAFRGYVFQNLGHCLPLWLTVALSSLLFAIILHMNRADFTLVFVIYGALLGCLLAFFRLGTQAIWFGIGMHWSWDWSQNYLFGFGANGVSLIHVQRRAPDLMAGNLIISGDIILQIIIIIILAVSMLAWLHLKYQLDWRARLGGGWSAIPLQCSGPRRN